MMMKALKFALLAVLLFPFASLAADDSKLRADLQAATDLACAKDASGEPVDAAVCQCNQFLLTQGLPTLSTVSAGIAGPISAAEKARIIKRTGVVGKAKEQLNMACAAAWMSIKGDLVD